MESNAMAKDKVPNLTPKPAFFPPPVVVPEPTTESSDPAVEPVTETATKQEPPTVKSDAPVIKSDEPAAPVVRFRKAIVSCPGTHVKAIPVTILSSEPNQEQAAIDAAKKKFGIQAFGAGPVVRFLD